LKILTAGQLAIRCSLASLGVPGEKIRRPFLFLFVRLAPFCRLTRIMV
jgi:hypothetical protein